MLVAEMHPLTFLVTAHFHKAFFLILKKKITKGEGGEQRGRQYRGKFEGYLPKWVVSVKGKKGGNQVCQVALEMKLYTLCHAEKVLAALFVLKFLDSHAF